MRHIRLTFAVATIIASMTVSTKVFAVNEVHTQIDSIARDCALVVFKMRRSPGEFTNPENKRAAYDIAEKITSEIYEFERLLEGNKADQHAAQERAEECLQAFSREADRLGWQKIPA